VLLLTLFGLAWRQTQQRSAAIGLTSSLLLLIASQAALGMWTVEMKVMPLIVTSHLLLGFLTFWTLSWSYLRTHPELALRPFRVGPGRFAVFAMLVLGAQIFLGGWVSSNYAALACSDFPRCNGVWQPDADFAGALNVFQGLLSGDSSPLSPEAKLAAHWLHRLGSVISFIVLSWLMLAATSEEYPKAVRRSGVLLSLLLLIQIALGIANI